MKRRTVFGAITSLVLPPCLSACRGLTPEQVGGGEIVTTRAPLPTVTPGVVEQEIVEAAQSTRLADVQFLGLDVQEWINLALALLIGIVGYLVTIWLIRLVFRWIVSRIAPHVGEEVRRAIGRQMQWLLLIALLYIVTLRLTILNAVVKRLLLDTYFLCAIVLITIVFWRQIDIAIDAYRRKIDDADHLAELNPALVLLSRMARILLISIVTGSVLHHFGINVAAFTAAIGLLGLALSLAARDTIADIIAGFLILFDRPFRVGDRIEIEEANTWGDVLAIGLRTTRLLTGDNRMVIVPNSIIGSNQIINYSYPEPYYRIQVDVGIAYGTDVEHARRVMVETVRQVDGVVAEMGVDILYLEMGSSEMSFRIRWWIATSADNRRMIDKVNTALQVALNRNGIVIPFPTQNIIVLNETQAAIGN